MKKFKITFLAVWLIASLLAVQVPAEQRESGNFLDGNQFPTSIKAEQTDLGYRFTMSVTNNSGTDITVDQMPIFANLFLWDGAQSVTHYLRGKNWDYDPKLFSNGQKIDEVYDLTFEQLRDLDGRADGNYVFYAVPGMSVNNEYRQSQMTVVYHVFEISTGEDPLPPVTDSNDTLLNENVELINSLDSNQFETSITMIETKDGYRFEMRVTNNSGTDMIVDKTPIFSNIMLWDDTKQTWYKMRDIERGQEIQPQMFANGQTITENFEFTIEQLRAYDGQAKGDYTFTAQPNLIINDEKMQLTAATKKFAVMTEEDSFDNPDGGEEPGTDDSDTEERPPLERESDETATAPDEETGINYLSFPTEISTEQTVNGQKFIMKVTNNSGRDIMVDQLPIFSRLIVYDVQTTSWLYLREKSWEYKPALFAAGTTITEMYETQGLAVGKYYFYAVPSVVIKNRYNQLMNVSSEFELK